MPVKFEEAEAALTDEAMLSLWYGGLNGIYTRKIAVADTVDPRTGQIVAMAQSRPVMGDGPGETRWNYSVRYDMGGADGYLFGSTFKT